MRERTGDSRLPARGGISWTIQEEVSPSREDGASGSSECCGLRSIWKDSRIPMRESDTLRRESAGKTYRIPSGVTSSVQLSGRGSESSGGDSAITSHI